MAALSVAALAGTAFAGIGDTIVYTSFNDNSIKAVFNPGGSNTVQTLVNYGGAPFSAGNIRLSGIAQGNNGKWYVGNGPIVAGDDNWATSAIFEVSDLFGSPTTTNFLAGSPVQNPIDVDFDATGNLLWIQNPFRRTSPAQVVNDGIYGSSVNIPAAAAFFTETAAGARPFYEAGVYLTKDPNSSDYFVTALNGGVGLPGQPIDDDSSSTLWRLSPNFANPAASTLTLVHDFTGATQGETAVQIRGITAVPGTNELYVTNNVSGFPYPAGQVWNGAPAGVYRITLDNNGNFLSKTLINGNILQPEAIEYNPFTGKLVISSFNDLNGNQLPEEGRIYQMNLDGSGLEVIVEGDFARDFEFVPTPGTIFVGALAGLAGLRRRR
ncbi:MAG: hypothetical protein SFZ24_00200 [Planctomycetota bacterium]|nr:hypothetical protein [Planctomycetota bacterium]